ncbi:hypothetical protein TNIN_262931 [Trichonephila inaurata madagascariensis]|uniref:Uncharacterized protein n=1 Tax=Trichonephila inaurata madagascariensis TaxID=2747483 RepID=A0A8X7CIS4_9ARAC|nr:hypothetical protein TNIN_262931 [Trichonephila inaurata madagascariensis]
MCCSTWEEPKGQCRKQTELQLSLRKVEWMQRVKPADVQARLKYAVHFQDFSTEQQDILQNLIMSEEAHFHLIGDVIRQNCRIWPQENDRCFL